MLLLAGAFANLDALPESTLAVAKGHAWPTERLTLGLPDGAVTTCHLLVCTAQTDCCDASHNLPCLIMMTTCMRKTVSILAQVFAAKDQ